MASNQGFFEIELMTLPGRFEAGRVRGGGEGGA